MHKRPLEGHSAMCWESDCGASEASGAPFTISRFQRFTCSPFLLFTFSSFQLFTCSLSYLSTAFKENKTHGIFLFKLRSTLMLPGLEIPLKYPKTAFVKDLAFKENKTHGICLFKLHGRTDDQCRARTDACGQGEPCTDRRRQCRGRTNHQCRARFDACG